MKNEVFIYKNPVQGMPGNQNGYKAVIRQAGEYWYYHLAEFYYSTPEKITIVENGQVYNNGRKLSTIVIKQGKKYIFGK